MRKTLLYTLLVMLVALVGCEKFESLGFEKEKTDWNEVCATARVWLGTQAGEANDTIDRHAGIYYAAWRRCQFQYDDEDESCEYSCMSDRDRECGIQSGRDASGNNYGRDNSNKYNENVGRFANEFCNTVLGRNEMWW